MVSATAIYLVYVILLATWKGMTVLVMIPAMATGHVPVIRHAITTPALVIILPMLALVAVI